MTTVEGFGGLDLVADPEEVTGAIDLLNVDLDKRGRVRSRDGFDNLTASAAASRLSNLGPFYKTDGTKQILASSNAAAGLFLRAYSTAGAVVATDSTGFLPSFAVEGVDFTRFGGPAAEVAYATGLQLTGSFSTPIAPRKWNGSTWANVATMSLGGHDAYMLEVQATDNRLVGAFPSTTSQGSRLGFSGAGTPETFGANDYIDLTPGDGEKITAIVAWRELVFAFKETKYFVFPGNSVKGDGTAQFNDRPVSTGVGAVGRACATATPNGVYFMSRRGIYKTVGGDPVLVSRAIDPVFRGGASAFFLGGVLNHAAINACQLAWHDERLYFSYPSGSATSNDRTFVYDPEGETWNLWDVAANGLTSFRIGDQAELVFTYAAGSNHIGRLSSSFTTDDGVAITSRYQSGFSDFGSAKSKRLRGLSLWGSGSPTVQVASDLGAVDTGSAVTLGTAPAVAKGYQRTSRRGTLLSYKLSASTPWAATRLDLDIADERVGP